jgi:hypothetical protein
MILIEFVIGDYQGAMFNNWRAQNMLARNANNEERKQVRQSIHYSNAIA